MNKAIFLDKDGTVIKNVHYSADPSKVMLEPFAGVALKRLRQAGYLLIIISNQSGIALGYFTEEELSAANRAMLKLLSEENVTIDAFYYCPHHVDGIIKKYAKRCGCRKPAAGMLLQAAKEWNIDLHSSWMVGDIADDIEAGHKAGCNTVLISPFSPPQRKKWNSFAHDLREPEYTVSHLNEMADVVLSHVYASQHEPMEKM